MAFGEKASCESTPPSQYSASCRQQGPAVALCLWSTCLLYLKLSILSYMCHLQTELVMPLSIMVVQDSLGWQGKWISEWKVDLMFRWRREPVFALWSKQVSSV